MGFLRILLALSVVIAHSEPFFGFKLIGGDKAVELFFIISGFYMAMILNNKYTGAGSYKIFIQNRFLKIYPIYILSIVLIIGMSLASFIAFDSLGKLQIYNQYFDDINLFSFIFLVLSNILIFGQDLVMFLGLDTSNGTLFFTEDFRTTTPMLFEFLLNPPAWSIAVELTFYLIAPLILRKSIKLILLIALISFSIKFIVLADLTNDPWSYRFFPSELCYFLLGSLSYRISTAFFDKIDNKIKTKIGYTTLTFNIIYISFYEYIDMSFSLFLILFAMSIPFIFFALKRSKLDRDIGELSYPIYILHYIMLMICNKLLSNSQFEYLTSEIVFFMSVLASIICIKLLMTPLETYRQKRASRLIIANA
ncbi:acyltransferase family protein [Photobacterium kishitanii]|uniref:acyltransferase family protein n=1 Tax=Photobacterium kishitanii TaxID=318456 RepID=UPI0015E78750|nr:acyltransferase [Photobacterium kishitanii]